MDCVNQAPLQFSICLEWPLAGTKRRLEYGKERGWSVYFCGPLSMSLCLRLQGLLNGPFLELLVVSSNNSLYLLSVATCLRMPHHPLWFPLTLLLFVTRPQLSSVTPSECPCCDIVSEDAKEGRKDGLI